MSLPSGALYCPSLSCDVYDYIFKGLSQPLLGTFSISIGEIIEQTKYDQMMELEESDKIIKELKKILNSNSEVKVDEEIKEDHLDLKRINSKKSQVLDSEDIKLEKKETVSSPAKRSMPNPKPNPLAKT